MIAEASFFPRAISCFFCSSAETLVSNVFFSTVVVVLLLFVVVVVVVLLVFVVVAFVLFFFDFCKRNFSRNVALLHDYGLYDFTIIVRKNI